jgi:hypothetical protein
MLQRKMLASFPRRQRHTGATAIRGARYATGPHTAVRGSIEIDAGRILRLSAEPFAPRTGATEIDLSDFLLLPGLINAHDHLHYPLHPRLGHPPYRNYVEWGDDIHATLSSVIAHYKRIPLDVRLWWGAIRNLLCGVTTVCHHDPFWPPLEDDAFPIRVLRNYGWAHSLALAPDLPGAWMSTPPEGAFFVHACEGIDERASQELQSLDTAGVLQANSVIVHGLALNASGIALLEERQVSLIVCLSSNQFLFGRLPDLERLGNLKRIALGNDSPLTAAGDLLDEVRFALDHTSVSSAGAWRMITCNPAAMMRLSNGEGSLRESGFADLIAIRDHGGSPHPRLRTLSWRDVELVMVAGEVRVASDEVAGRLPSSFQQDLEPLAVEGCTRWLRAPVRRLLQQAEEVLGAGRVLLGGRSVQLPGRAAPRPWKFAPSSVAGLR